jgi:hypothetical protein
MADDKLKTGKPDRERVNINEPYELADWAAKFGVSADDIRAAVAKVGAFAKDVERELKR